PLDEREGAELQHGRGRSHGERANAVRQRRPAQAALNGWRSLERPARRKTDMQMRHVLGLTVGLTCAAPFLSGDDFRWQGHVAAGETLEIKGVNGGIEAE